MDNQEQVWTVGATEAGTRLDKFLASQLDHYSRSEVQALISEGHILVNGRARKASYALREGEEVRPAESFPTSEPQLDILPQEMPLEILYEDRDLVIINKPAGMVVHPAPGHTTDTLVNGILARYPEWMQTSERERPGIVHRLDRDTSGLIIVARHAEAQAKLSEMMKDRSITKRYLSLVQGVLALEQGTIDAPIGRDPRYRQQMTITAQEGREARTHFLVKQRFNRHTLVMAQLETGRTHQIRVHFQAIKHPVLGDPVYGSGHIPHGVELKRQFLHASQLQFTQPFTGEAIDVSSPLPADLQGILDREEYL